MHGQDRGQRSSKPRFGSIPDSWEANKEAARAFTIGSGKIEEATRHLEKATELAETDFHSRGCFRPCTSRAGDHRAQACAAKMIEHVERALARDPDNGAALAYGALSFAAIGRCRAGARMDRSRVDARSRQHVHALQSRLAGARLSSTTRKRRWSCSSQPCASGGQDLISLAAADPQPRCVARRSAFPAMLEGGEGAGRRCSGCG